MTPGRRRGLAQLAGPRGAIALGLADGADPLLPALAPHLTAVALEAEAAACALMAGLLPGRLGLAVELHEPGGGLRPGCPPASARRLGASAGLLAVDSPDAPSIAEAVALCDGEDLPLVLHGPAEAGDLLIRRTPPRDPSARWVLELADAPTRTMEAAVAAGCRDGASGFALPLGLLAGLEPLDEAVPLVSALRATVEEWLAAAVAA